MSDYEHIVISAVEYAIGRMTYIVSLTVEYVIKDIEQGKLSKECLQIIKRDIKEAKHLGMECDEKDWQRLLDRIEKELR